MKLRKGYKVLKAVEHGPESGLKSAMSLSGAYVYEHWRPDTGTCFYVGKGRGKRARDKTRNEHHASIAAKLKRLGFRIDVQIVAAGLSDVEAFALEIERIAYWRGRGVRLANLTDGGDGPSNPTEEVRQKIREARKRHVITDDWRANHRAAMADPETRALMSAAAKRRPTSFKGRSHSDETKARWSAIRKGRVLTPEHRAKISAGLLVNNGFKGKTHTTEARAQISAHNKTRDLSYLNFTGRTHTAEAKARISAANKGRVLSAETRQKISEAKRAGVDCAP